MLPYSPANGSETAQTLSETLSLGQAALAAGDYESAYQAFVEIDTTFKREPEVATDSFQLVVLPIKGYAALLTERFKESIDAFDSFIQRFPKDRTRTRFVLFNMAMAQSQIGHPNEAIETYRRFVALDPERAEATLATLEAVRLMFENGREDEAFEALENLISLLRPGVLRNKARLIALQKSLDLGYVEQARGYMLEENWVVTENARIVCASTNCLGDGQ